MEQKNPKHIFNELKADILALIDSKIKYAKLSAIKTGSRVGSFLIYNFILFIPIILLAFFGLTTLALLFSQIFHSYLLGFGAVFLIILVILLIMLLIKQPIKKSITNKIIDEIINEEDDNNVNNKNQKKL